MRSPNDSLPVGPWSASLLPRRPPPSPLQRRARERAAALEHSAAAAAAAEERRRAERLADVLTDYHREMQARHPPAPPSFLPPPGLAPRAHAIGVAHPHGTAVRVLHFCVRPPERRPNRALWRIPRDAARMVNTEGEPQN